MPRRREVPKREILPDPKFHNQEVAKFMNVIMQAGKSQWLNESFMGLLIIFKKAARQIR
jgi:ribosomal protein S7